MGSQVGRRVTRHHDRVRAAPTQHADVSRRRTNLSASPTVSLTQESVLSKHRTMRDPNSEKQERPTMPSKASKEREVTELDETALATVVGGTTTSERSNGGGKN